MRYQKNFANRSGDIKYMEYQVTLKLLTILNKLKIVKRAGQYERSGHSGAIFVGLYVEVDR